MQKWLFVLLVMFFCLGSAGVWAQEAAPNRVLSLDGDGDYVEMADSEALNDINSQVTVEAWIRPTAFLGPWPSILFKGDEYTTNLGNRSYFLFLNTDGRIRLRSASSEGGIFLDTPTGLITSNIWYHVASIIDVQEGTMRTLINGIEVARGDSGEDIYVSALPFRIGWTHEEEGMMQPPFAGQIDEVRIWNVARTNEEIQSTMHSSLSGEEVGLAGYWRFEDVADTVTDSSPGQANGKLIGDAHLVEADLPTPDQLTYPTMLSGNVTDEAGKPVKDAIVSLTHDDVAVFQTKTDDSGKYLIALYSPSGQYDVSAVAGDLGHWELGIKLREGKHRVLGMTLKKAVSIEGRLTMLDDATPHVAVVVQAVRDGKFISTALSDEKGEYQLINLNWPLNKLVA